MKMIQFNYSWGIIKLFLGKHAMYSHRFVGICLSSFTICVFVSKSNCT